MAKKWEERGLCDVHKNVSNDINNEWRSAADVITIAGAICLGMG